MQRTTYQVRDPDSDQRSHQKQPQPHLAILGRSYLLDISNDKYISRTDRKECCLSLSISIQRTSLETKETGNPPFQELES